MKKLKKQVVMELDVPTQDGKIWLYEVVAKAIAEFDDNFIKQDRAYGELGRVGIYEDPFSLELASIVCLAKSSHKITKLYIKDNFLLCDVEVLDTPRGKDLSKLLSFMQFRPRAMGIVELDDNGDQLIIECDIISFDAVQSEIGISV